MKTFNKFLALALLAAFVVTSGCDKTNPYDTKEAEPQVHFTGDPAQVYVIETNPAPSYTIVVGTTDIADVDREVGFSVAGSAGAVAGTDFTITPSNNKIVIPAGKATANITVQGNYSSYTAGQKDTLTFTLTEPSVKVANFSNSLKLVLRGPCFEGDIVLSDFLGNYTKTIETFGANPAYGPYTTTISAVNQLTATTGTITVNNIWDNGWSPLTFTLDWTNPANRTATVVTQSVIGGSDAGDINGAYAGQTIQVRPFSGNAGTFSWCNGKLTLKMQLGVTNVGYFGSLYTVNMSR